MKKLQLAFGALWPPVSKQIKTQFPELEHDEAKLRFFDRQAENVTFLRIHNVITGSEAKKADQRVMKQVSDYVQRLILDSNPPHEE